MALVRRGRVYSAQMATFLFAAAISLYFLPTHLQILLAILLLIARAFALPLPTPQLIWGRFIHQTASLLWDRIRSILGLLAIFAANFWAWLSRNRPAGNGATVAPSHPNPSPSEFFARHPNWRTPAASSICAMYALYFLFSGGFTAWGMVLGIAICAFTLSRISLILTFASSIASLYYGITATYRKYLDRISYWKEGVPVSGEIQTRKQVRQSFWSAIFNSNSLKTSTVVPRTDPQGNIRVLEPPSRPSIIHGFLSTDSFTTTKKTTIITKSAPQYSKIFDSLMSRMSARTPIIIHTVPELLATESVSVPSQSPTKTASVPSQRITETSSWWEFWNKESTPDSKHLSSEVEAESTAKSEMHKDRQPLKSLTPHSGHKTLKSFANDVLTAASTQESKSIEDILSVTDTVKSRKSETAAKVSISKEAKERSMPEQKSKSTASRYAKKSLSIDDKAQAQASKVAEKIAVAEDKARLYSIKEAEKTLSAEAMAKSIPKKAENEMKSRDIVMARYLKGRSLSSGTRSISMAMEKESETPASATSGVKSTVVRDDTEYENKRYIAHDGVIENLPTPIKKRPGLFSSFWTTAEPAQNVIRSVDFDASSSKQASHSVADKIMERATKVTEIISATVTDLVTGTNHHGTGGIPSTEDSYVDQFVNAISSAISTGVFGTLDIFSTIIPRSVGPDAIPFDEYSAGPPGPDLEYCPSCPKTALIYTFLIGLSILIAPPIRSMIFHTKIKTPTLVVTLIAFIFWAPSMIALAGGLVYRNRFELGDALQPFHGTFFFLAFVLLASAKIGRTMINAFSYHFLSHPEPTRAPQLSPGHVTVILPYTFRTSKPGKNFEDCIESILPNKVNNVVLLVHDVDTCAAAEQFAMRYNRYYTLSVYLSIAGDKRTRFIECCRRQRTPIIIFVEKGTVVWDPNFLRAAIPPFEDSKTALVAPAFHAYSRAADVMDVLPANLDDIFTSPSTPTGAQYDTMTLHRTLPPLTHTLTQKFLLHLAKVQVSRYNFSNTATYNLDGFTTPLSHHTLLVRTDVLHTATFQDHFFRHPDPTTSITQWVQSAGLQTVFLNSRFPLVHLCVKPEQAQTSLFSYATTTVLKTCRLRARYAIDSLLKNRNTYQQYPWSTFSVHLFNLMDIPLLYDFLILYTMQHSANVGKGRTCQLIITLLMLKVLERPSITISQGTWYIPNLEFWVFLLPVLVWEYVVESLMGLWGLVTCFGELRERAMDEE